MIVYNVGNRFTAYSFSDKTALTLRVVNHFEGRQMREARPLGSSFGKSKRRAPSAYDGPSYVIMSIKSVSLPTNVNMSKSLFNEELTGGRMGVSREKVKDMFASVNDDAQRVMDGVDAISRRTKTLVQIPENTMEVHSVDHTTKRQITRSVLKRDVLCAAATACTEFSPIFKALHDRGRGSTESGIRRTREVIDAWDRIQMRIGSIDKYEEHYGKGIFEREELYAISKFELPEEDMSKRLMTGGKEGETVRYTDHTGAFSPIVYFKEYPYRLLDILKQRQFAYIDEHIVRRLYEKSAQYRVNQCASYMMRGMEGVCIPKDLICDILVKLFGSYSSGIESRDIVNSITDFRGVVVENGYIYPRVLYDVELEICNRVRGFVEYRDPLRRTYVDYMDREGLSEDDDQAAALRMTLLDHALVIINGMAGTGKTTILNQVCRAFDRAGVPVNLMAPTGKAATRISEKTHREASTIHRTVRMHMPAEAKKSTKKRRKTDNDTEKGIGKIKGVVIIDEASMMDAFLFLDLLRTCAPERNRIILVGDTAQLDPVGKGRVFLDLIKSERIPTVTLNRVHRQGCGALLPNAIAIRNYNAEQTTAPHALMQSDTTFQMTLTGGRDTIDMTVEQCVKYLVNHRESVQVIAPKRDTCSRLNAKLRDVYNPLSALNKDDDTITVGSTTDTLTEWRRGDSVICTSNQYRDTPKDTLPADDDDDDDSADKNDNDPPTRKLLVCNGEQGTIIDIDHKEKRLIVKFPKIDHVHSFAALSVGNTKKCIDLSYAITVHKAQGSEFDRIVLCMPPDCAGMLTNKLVYTAVTRASEHITILCQPSTFDTAVKTRDRDHNGVDVAGVNAYTNVGQILNRLVFSQISKKI